MQSEETMHFRKTRARALATAIALGITAQALPACWVATCDPGEQQRAGVCFDAPAEDAGTAGSAGDTADTNAGAGGDVGSAIDTFGKSCKTNADCADGNAPICGGPLAYCIQINCGAGEANAGACPVGWTCLPKTASPQGISACIRN